MEATGFEPASPDFQPGALTNFATLPLSPVSESNRTGDPATTLVLQASTHPLSISDGINAKTACHRVASGLVNVFAYRLTETHNPIAA